MRTLRTAEGTGAGGGNVRAKNRQHIEPSSAGRGRSTRLQEQDKRTMSTLSIRESTSPFTRARARRTRSIRPNLSISSLVRSSPVDSTGDTSTSTSTEVDRETTQDIPLSESPASRNKDAANIPLIKKRKYQKASPIRNDSSLPDVEDLLFASPKVHKRIDAITKGKFNYKSNPYTPPEHAKQIERLLTSKDIESLTAIADESSRKDREHELLKRQSASDKAKIMWMEGEIERWRELARRITVGSNSHDGSNSRQDAFVQLCGELKGWRACQEGEDSN